MPSAAAWMQLEIIILSEVSQKEKDKYHMLLLLLLSHFSRVRLCATPQTPQPTRLLCPWDSPGKNTGVGCHFLFQCMKVKSDSEVAQSCPTLRDLMDCSLPGFMGFSRQEYWSGVPLPSPYNTILADVN